MFLWLLSWENLRAPGRLKKTSWDWWSSGEQEKNKNKSSNSQTLYWQPFVWSTAVSDLKWSLVMKCLRPNVSSTRCQCDKPNWWKQKGSEKNSKWYHGSQQIGLKSLAYPGTNEKWDLTEKTIWAQWLQILSVKIRSEGQFPHCVPERL